MNLLFKHSRFILLLILMLACNLLGQDSNERPTYRGISPAYPIKEEILRFTESAPYMSRLSSFELKLQIDKEGKVSGCKPVNPHDSLISNHILSGVMNLQFLPAAIDGRPVKSVLIIEAIINPGVRQSAVNYPIDSKKRVTDNRLYFATLENFGISLPKLTKFPSYFCDLNPRDTTELLPYLLLKVSLDENGTATGTEVVGNTIGAFSNQILSAVLWSEFEPMKINQVPTATECFLVIGFHPQFKYPTKQIDFANDSVFEWNIHQMVRLYPDTVGTMIPAIPVKRNYSNERLKGGRMYLSGETIGTLIFDSSGNAKLGQIDSKNKDFYKYLSISCRKWSFYPAMDFSGKPIDFSGITKFKFIRGTEVMLQHLWLEKRLVKLYEKN